MRAPYRCAGQDVHISKYTRAPFCSEREQPLGIAGATDAPPPAHVDRVAMKMNLLSSPGDAGALVLHRSPPRPLRTMLDILFASF